MNLLLVGFFSYFVVLLGIGIWSFLRVKDLDDFLLGGRRLGPWVTAISERASGESSWFLMGLPAAAYGLGLFEFWSVIGIAFGIFTSWVLIALPLRRGSEELGALTLPEYFALRYPRFGKRIRLLAAAAIVIFYVSYLSAQLLGAGKIFAEVLEWPREGGILLGAGIVVTYTLLGGFLAVAWTDLIQGLMMATISVLLPVLAICEVGLVPLLDATAEARPETFFVLGNFALGEAAEGFGLGAIVGGLAWGLGYLGQPHLLTRYMAIEKPSEVRRSTLIAMGWVLVAYWGVVFVGFFAVAILGGDLPEAEHELVVARMAERLLPAWIAGFVSAGILAAIMSSADSQLLAATSSVVEDILVKLLGVRLERRRLVLLTRVVTAGITVAALLPLMWKQAENLIYGIVAFAWAGLGSTFGPALVLTLWWRRTSGLGVLLGMVTGVTSTILWDKVPALAAVLDIKIASPLLALLAVILGSLVEPAGDERNGSRDDRQPGSDAATS